jgi:hypothetical protein
MTMRHYCGERGGRLENHYGYDIIAAGGEKDAGDLPEYA